MREYYRKVINKSKHFSGGSAAKRIKQYVYSDLLAFLNPILDSRRTEGNFSTITEDYAQGEVQNLEGSSNETAEVEAEKNTSREKIDITTEIADILRQRQNANEMDDDDTQFLLSFRSEMKSMSPGEKAEFKINMLELVRKRHMHTLPSTAYNPIRASSLRFCFPYCAHPPVQQISSLYYDLATPQNTVQPPLQRIHIPPSPQPHYQQNLADNNFSKSKSKSKQ